MVSTKRIILQSIIVVLVVLLALSSLLAKNTYSLKADLYPLIKTNWDGHYEWPGRSDWYGIIGGYSRSSSVPDDQEVLCKFNFTNMTGTVVGAKLRFKIFGGSQFNVYTHIAAYEQNKGYFYPPYLKYYYYSGTPWDHLLGEKITYPQQDEWIELSSPELISQVQKWINNPESDKGLMLTANMYHATYNLMITDVTLSVDVQDSSEFSWKKTAHHDFAPFSSSPHAMTVAPDGTVYVAYRRMYMVSPPDPFSQVGVQVLKYTNNSWQDVGGLASIQLNVSGFLDIEVAADGTPYLSYASNNSGGKAMVKKFNGISWESVGAEFISDSQVGVFGTDLAFSPSGELYAAYFADKCIYVKKFNGTGWQMVGQKSGSYLSGSAARPGLAFASDGTPYTIFKVSESGNPVHGTFSKTSVVKLVNDSWEYVGGCVEGYYDENGNFSIESRATKIAIDSNDIPYVVLLQREDDQDRITVKKFIGDKWTKVNHSLYASFDTQFMPDLVINSKNVPLITMARYDVPGTNLNRSVVLQDVGNEWAILSAGTGGDLGFETAPAYYPTLAISNDDTPYVFYSGNYNDMYVKYFSK